MENELFGTVTVPKYLFFFVNARFYRCLQSIDFPTSHMAFVHLYSSSKTTIQVAEGCSSEKNYLSKLLLVVTTRFRNSVQAVQHNFLIHLRMKNPRKHKELSNEARVGVCSVLTYKKA